MKRDGLFRQIWRKRSVTMAFIEDIDWRSRKNKHFTDSADPRNQIWECSVGSQHYQVGADWVDIDTAWKVDTGAWQYKAIQNSFQLHARDVLNAGDTLQIDTQDGTQNVTLQPLALNWVDNLTDSRQQITQPQAVSAIVIGSQLYWPNGYGEGRHFRSISDADYLIKQLIIDSPSNLPVATVANPYIEVEFILKKSAGLAEYINGQLWDRTTKTITAEAIEFRLSGGEVVWAFAKPRAYDSAGHSISGIMMLRRQGATRYVTVRFPKSWLDTATFPVTLDPTIDKTVAANLDDSLEEDDGTGSEATNDDYYEHHSPGGGGAKRYAAAGFTEITIADGSTITVSNLQWHAGAFGIVDLDTTIYGEDVASPANYNLGFIYNRARTTASVSWTATVSEDVYATSPSLNTIVQELIDTYTYSSGRMAFTLVSKTTGSCYLSGYTRGAAYAPKLHIEYTEGGGGIIYGAATLSGATNLEGASLVQVKAASQIIGGTGMIGLSNLQIPASSQLIGGTNLTGTSLVQVRAASELVASALLAGTGLNEIKIAANLLGSGQINSSGFLQILGLTQLVANGHIDGTGFLQIISSSQIIGGANLLGTVLLQVLGATQLVGSGLLEASGDISNGMVYGRANLLGNAELSGIPTMLVLSASQLVGTGGLTAASFLIIPSSVVLSGSGVLQGSSILIVSASSLLSGSAELSAIGYNLGQVVLGAANLTGNASISGTGKVNILAEVVLTGLASLSGSSSITVYGDGIINGSANLSSVPMLIIQAIAELVGSGVIVADGRTFETSITTPDNRTYVIPMEVRTFVINGETRIYVIPAETRIYAIPAK